MLRSEILGLYKNLLRYGQSLKYTDKKYFISRVRRNFLNNSSLTDEQEIEFQFKVKRIDGPEEQESRLTMFATIFRTLPRIFLPSLESKCVSTSATQFISVKKKHLDFSKVPKVDENDLEIQYVRGSGPGGQATNKTSNCVVMKHLPSGIVVKCHQTRSQAENKKLAVEILINKLDILINGEDAIENQKKKILRKKAMEKKRRHKKRAEEKAAMKANSDVSEDSSPQNCT
ncbi:hypothetical protein QAD02_011261 [Eretmocerus hayati]|uniref:Uncharacterized protein n=1 Tax=Eretmocerus hayati TaxID=131215 RepID=A0ACC2NW04_9HYME|nr:hypothetical protein QAD02_011261 [Eretmocerus hayati]